MKTVAIIQSNYIPWKGYFDIISRVEEFVLYDTAKYTARSWRNRNLIKTPAGPSWLTIPVHYDHQSFQPMNETRTVDHHWRKKHWKNIVQNYQTAPFFKTYGPAFESLYLDHDEELISDINYRFITAVNEMLAIKTRISRLENFAMTGDKSADLIAVCKQVNATHYLSGPAGKAFLSESAFNAAQLKLIWMEYAGYPEYHQFYPPFVHEVSILDLIFHTGPEARDYFRSPVTLSGTAA